MDNAGQMYYRSQIYLLPTDLSSFPTQIIERYFWREANYLQEPILNSLCLISLLRTPDFCSAMSQTDGLKISHLAFSCQKAKECVKVDLAICRNLFDHLCHLSICRCATQRPQERSQFLCGHLACIGPTNGTRMRIYVDSRRRKKTRICASIRS